MRLYRVASGEGARIVVEAGGRAVDLAAAWSGTEPHVVSMLTLIQAGPAHWARVRACALEAADEHVVDLAGARLLCPLDAAASLRDFLAFEDHVVNGARRRDSVVPDYWYEAPIYYKGNHRSLLGPEDTAPWPSYTKRLDFELELAMIVGVGGRDISPDDAAGHIFGFTVMNDWSARDIQAREMTAWLGPAKGKDFATSLGPCIVTTDEVGPEPDLEMICRVNGEEWDRARSGEMYWSWAQLLGHVSRDEEIFPGDVYGSGTPGGCCGLDQGRDLSPGDIVELEIEGLGTLRNQVAEPSN